MTALPLIVIPARDALGRFCRPDHFADLRRYWTDPAYAAARRAETQARRDEIGRQLDAQALAAAPDGDFGWKHVFAERLAFAGIGQDEIDRIRGEQA